MGKKSRPEKQLKLVKRRLDQERKAPRGRKIFAIVLTVSGSLSLLLVGAELLQGKTTMITGMCMMMGVISLFLAHKIYTDEAARVKKVEALEREYRDLLDNDDD